MYESAEQLTHKIAYGEVHLGKEMMVVVACCFNENETYPILTAPSCKEEDHTDWQSLMLIIINSWYTNDAHTMIGQLWSFTTDGDSTCCKAGHKVFMQSKLTSSSLIYAILSGDAVIRQMTFTLIWDCISCGVYEGLRRYYHCLFITSSHADFVGSPNSTILNVLPSSRSRPVAPRWTHGVHPRFRLASRVQIKVLRNGLARTYLSFVHCVHCHPMLGRQIGERLSGGIIWNSTLTFNIQHQQTIHPLASAGQCWTAVPSGQLLKQGT